MISPIRVLAALGFSAALWAQGQPQLVWEGEVDGSAVIYVRGKKLRVEDKGAGDPVRLPSYRFSEQLPDSRQDVEVRVAQGRGEVRVLEQPTLENKYTLAVMVDDRQEGPAFYSLQFFWKAGLVPASDPFERKKPLPAGGFAKSLTWSGRVEGRVRVMVQGRETHAETAAGATLPGTQAHFVRELPARPSRVDVRKRRGRGRVDVIESPSKKNGYRLTFEVLDPGPGSDEYEVELGW